MKWIDYLFHTGLSLFLFLAITIFTTIPEWKAAAVGIGYFGMVWATTQFSRVLKQQSEEDTQGEAA